MKIALFVLFLAMYTIVVNNRTDYPTFVEWFVYVFVCGYIFEEFRLVMINVDDIKEMKRTIVQVFTHNCRNSLALL